MVGQVDRGITRGAALNYYARHIGDYLRDTAHLSLLEHGVYTRLLDVYYTREASFPVDSGAIARLVGARAKDEISALKTVLSEFFTVTDTGYTHKRCDAEIAKYQERSAVNREVGKRGGRPKKTQTVIENNPDGFVRLDVVGSENNPNQEPITNNQEPKEKQLPRTRRVFAPIPVPDWMPVAEWDAYCKHRGASFTEVAQSMAVTQLAEWRSQGHRPEEVLRRAVMNGWKGLFLDRNAKPKADGMNAVAAAKAAIFGGDHASQ